MMNRLVACGLASVGLAYAVYSSQPILDPSLSAFSPDEGWYLSNGSSGVITVDLRYAWFSWLVRGYFLVIQDPFWVAVLHKSLLLGVFMLFQPMLVRKYGNRVFILLYFSFTFLNGYFLRDSLIFLCVLLAISRSSCSVWRWPAMVPLALIRPQGLLLFLQPLLSVVALLCFVFFMRHLYASLQFSEKGFVAVFQKLFWKDIGATSLTTLANLNPAASLRFYATKGDYLKWSLVTLASVPMFAVFTQMALATRWQQYRNAELTRLWTGILGLLVIYGSIRVPIDKRIFISLITPVIIFVNPSLLRIKNLLWLAGDMNFNASHRDGFEKHRLTGASATTNKVNHVCAV